MATFLRRASSGLAYVSGGNLLGAVISFLVTVTLAQALGVKDYGLMLLALSIPSAMVVFTEWGLSSLLSADIAAYRPKGELSKIKKLLKQTLFIKVAISLSLMALLFLISDSVIPQFYSARVSSLVKIVALMLPLNVLEEQLRVIFIGFSKFNGIAWMRIFQPIFRLSLLILFLQMATLDLITATLLYPLSLLLSSLLVIPLLIGVFRKLRSVASSKENVLKETIKEHGKYAIMIVPVKKGIDNLPLWLAGFLLGAPAAALFGLANKFYGFISLAVKSIEQVFLPLMAEQTVKGIQRLVLLFKKGLKFGFLLSLVAVAASIPLLPVVIEGLSLDKYVAAIPIAQVLMLNMIRWFSFMTVRPILVSTKNQKYLFLFYLSKLAILSSFGYVFLMLMGHPIGLAWATILTGILLTVIHYWILLKIDKAFAVNIRRDLLTIDEKDKSIYRRSMKQIRARLGF